MASTRPACGDCCHLRRRGPLSRPRRPSHLLMSARLGHPFGHAPLRRHVVRPHVRLQWLRGQSLCPRIRLWWRRLNWLRRLGRCRAHLRHRAHPRRRRNHLRLQRLLSFLSRILKLPVLMTRLLSWKWWLQSCGAVWRRGPGVRRRLPQPGLGRVRGRRARQAFLCRVWCALLVSPPVLAGPLRDHGPPGKPELLDLRRALRRRLPDRPLLPACWTSTCTWTARGA